MALPPGTNRGGAPRRACGEETTSGAPNSQKHGVDYPGKELDLLAAATNYYRWISSEFAPYLGSRMVEVGAGIGTVASHLLAAGDLTSLILVEPAGHLAARLESRFAEDRRIRVHHGYLEDLSKPDGGIHSVVMVNVLEHIRDDQAALTAAYRLLDEGGHCLLYVPALPVLFGSLDLAFGHWRRYTKWMLTHGLSRAGFALRTLRFVNMPGVVAWYVAGKILKQRTLTPWSVGVYDRFVVPFAAGVERRWEPPVGQSLLAVARK